MASPHQSGPTLGHVTLQALRRHPARIAFAWDGGQATYASVLDLIARFQAVFGQFGLRRGDRVALLSSNRYEGWVAGAAANASGLATSWLHPMGSYADHLAQIEDFEADALVVDAGVYGQRGGELAGSGHAPRCVLTLGKASYGDDALALAERAGSHTSRDLGQPEDIISINYTGGTTGKAKGAVRRHSAFVAANTATIAAFELPRAPRFLAAAPISHVGGAMVLPALMDGGTVHLLSRFDPEQVLAAIVREHISMSLLVPTMIYSLLDHPALDRTDLSSLELLLYGASPMSPTRLWEALDRVGPVFSQLYGQTEGFPLAVLPTADHDRSRPELVSSCGFPTSSCDIQLLDEHGAPVAPGEAGEVCVRAPFLMEGYWNRPEATAEALVDGWLHTSDIARQDEEGRLYIVDRKKDMLISGGFNIYPREVEDALTSHAGVAMAAVIGVPDAQWGETVRALVVRREGQEISADQLMQHVKLLKGSAHAPKQIDFVDTLPVTSLGKVDKKALRAVFWEGRDRLVN